MTLTGNVTLPILKFGDGDGPNLCNVKNYMLVPHLLKIYFDLGWSSSVLEIVSVTKIKNKIDITS